MLSSYSSAMLNQKIIFPEGSTRAQLSWHSSWLTGTIYEGSGDVKGYIQISAEGFWGNINAVSRFRTSLVAEWSSPAIGCKKVADSSVAAVPVS